MSDMKPFRIRTRVVDGTPREANKLKGTLATFLDVMAPNGHDSRLEFVIGADSAKHLEIARSKLASAGLQEIEGDTTYTKPGSKTSAPSRAPIKSGGNISNASQSQRSSYEANANGKSTPQTDTSTLALSKTKPYGFVALPKTFRADAPIWHDGSTSEGKVSGELRCELTNLTPLLVGWERALANGGDKNELFPLSGEVEKEKLKDKKPVLAPLRLDSGIRPVVLPGDTLKGFIRHELGALLGAPMERVDERSYSYRPNALFCKEPNPRLQARVARVVQMQVEQHQGLDLRIPVKVEVLGDLKYRKQVKEARSYYEFDHGGKPYRGGLGAGAMLTSKKGLHTSLFANPSHGTELPISEAAKAGYVATVLHLSDATFGHFSNRHPDIPKVVKGEEACERIKQAATEEVFAEGDYIWVEYDTQKKTVVSFGWNYYYRWAYVDSVRTRNYGQEQRQGLFPLPEELELSPEDTPEGIAAKGEIPKAISAVRRLFGYTGDNDGSKGIGKDDYSQLMGRIFVNAALEQGRTGERFMKPCYLKELGMPRPSAVEHYVQQGPHKRNGGIVDKAHLVTYGDAKGYDTPGELAGRKFYLDRADAYTATPWQDSSQANKDNERATLALNASTPESLFRFTVRFRDLEPRELAALLIALSPNQFKAVLGGTHPEGYCSKLGYAKPLGWGSVQITTKELYFLEGQDAWPELKPLQEDLVDWVKQHHETTETQEAWLAIHRRKHPQASDYPRASDGEIFTYHTDLRAQHSRQRRYSRY